MSRDHSWSTGERHCWLLLLSKAGGYLGRNGGNTVPCKTLRESRRQINCQKKKLMRGEAPADKKEGCPGGSFEKRDRKRNWRL